MKKSFYLFAILVIALLPSCDRSECENTNPVFDEYSPESLEYKEELLHRIGETDPEELRYWLKEYEERKDGDYLVFHVQGGELCALMEFKIDDDAGLEDIIEKKGVSYRGAEFVGLQYGIERKPDQIVFIYSTHERIVD